MGLFDRFKKQKTVEAKKSGAAREEEELEIYSGMRVEVTAFDGRLLFVAKLMSPRGDRAELYQYSEADIPEDTEPMHVRIRGYHDHERKAIYMEGIISPLPQHVWRVEELNVARIGNDRAFFRLDTNLDAAITTFGGLGAGEKPCKLLNISVGGANISSESRYHMGDKLLLKVQLLADRPVSAIFSQVVRVIEKDSANPE